MSKKPTTLKAQSLDSVGFLSRDAEKQMRKNLKKATEGELYEIKALVELEFGRRTGKIKPKKGRK
jgi:hypothetical protein